MGLATVDFRQAGGQLLEYEMVHCRHCRAGIPKRLYPDQEKAPGAILRAEKAQGGFCYPCGGAICLACIPKPCQPYMKTIEQLHTAIQRAISRNALADLLGLQGR
jgi:hypothetical protein